MRPGFPDPKALASLQARYALAGFELRPQPDGTYIAFRWGFSRELADMTEAEAFLRQVGGPQ